MGFGQLPQKRIISLRRAKPDRIGHVWAIVKRQRDRLATGHWWVQYRRQRYKCY